jgi:putative ABC transport system permease protein
MSPKDLFRTALSNLGRHKARTALTAIGVFVGILTIVTMVSLGVGVRREMGKAFDSVGLETVRLFPVTEELGEYNLFGMPERTKLLSRELVQQLETRDDVLSVTPYLNLPSGMRALLDIGDQEIQVSLRASAPASVPEPFQQPVKTLAGEADPPEQGGGLVIFEDTVTKLGYDEDSVRSLVGQVVELVLYAPRGESQAFSLRITGITSERWGDVRLALPDRLAMLQWWYNSPEYLDYRGYDEIVIRARSLNDAAQIVDWLSGLGYGVESLKAVLDMANRGMVVLQTMLGSVGTLALLVASLGIANTMIMAVYERTKEIGVLKAIGAAPGQIRALFVLEASLIGLLGGLAGIFLGWLLGKGLNVLIVQILRWQDFEMTGTYFVVSWWLALGALGFASLVGLLAGLYPAARAARLAPLDALRYE